MLCQDNKNTTDLSSPSLLVLCFFHCLGETPELAILPDRHPLSRLRKGLLLVWTFGPRGQDSAFDHHEQGLDMASGALEGREEEEMTARNNFALGPRRRERRFPVVQLVEQLVQRSTEPVSRRMQEEEEEGEEDEEDQEEMHDAEDA